MFTEGLVDRLAKEMYDVALTMQPEQLYDASLSTNDLFLVLLHRYRVPKTEWAAKEWPNENWSSQYGYGEQEALKLAFDKLVKDGLLFGDSHQFSVAKHVREDRLSRATWPFHSSAPPATSSPATAAPLEAAPPPHAPPD